jgi:hypothetical protein
MARAAESASARASEAGSPEAAASRGEGRSPTRAHSSARRLPIGYPTGLDIAKGIATPWAANAADPTRATCASDAAWTAGASNSSWPAYPSDPTRATCASDAAWTAGASNPSWPAYPSDAARTTDASNASWPANAPDASWATHAAATTKVHSTLCSASQAVIAESLLHARVVVPHSVAMLGAVLPVVADVVDVDRPICVNIAATPPHASAPVITT